jgi:cytochrome P450
MVTYVPPRITPPDQPLGRIGFMRTFVRNPLEVIPRAAYEEDFIAFGGSRLPRAWVTAPSLIKAILLDEREKFRKLTQIRLLSPLLGSGILTSEDAEWKWQRQAASPMFRPQELAAFVPAFVGAAHARLAAWGNARESTQQIEAEMTRATFDVIAATLLPSLDERLAPAIHESVRALQRSGGWDMLFAAMNLPHWLPRPGRASGIRAMRRLRGAVAAVIGERRAHEGGPDDLARRLMAAKDPESGQAMSDERLVDNVLTFYLAGHETTAKALTWTLYLLARSPEWTALVQDEIARVVGAGPVSAAHLDQLVLTQRVLKESMRLYPPVPIMSRQCVADARIEGHDIKAGTSLLMPIYAIHRHARRWDQPDAFMPERFANEAGIARYQYMPFGAGPRICIGMAFAMMEATAMLATFVQHASFAPVEGHEPTPIARVTLLPKGGMPLRVETRP